MGKFPVFFPVSREFPARERFARDCVLRQSVLGLRVPLVARETLICSPIAANLGTQLIQELIREGAHGVTRYAPKMDKVMRLRSIRSTIENGLVFLPETADWLAEYLHELTIFPNGRYDDQADSTSQALAFRFGLRSDYPQML